MAYELPDFDTLLALAKDDPQALDRIKQDAVNDLIESTDDKSQKRLRGLQWQVDVELKKSSNPMEGCIRVSEMMHDKLWELRVALENHDKGLVDEFFHDKALDQSADIIPLRG